MEIKKHYEFTRNQIEGLYEACRFIYKQDIDFNLDYDLSFFELKEKFGKDLEEIDSKSKMTTQIEETSK